MIKIQPKERPDMTLPYPYFIEEDGLVSRQDIWDRSPYKLIGFARDMGIHEIALSLPEFLRDPKKCIGLYPVFECYGRFEGDPGRSDWFTFQDQIESIDIIKN